VLSCGRSCGISCGLLRFTGGLVREISIRKIAVVAYVTQRFPTHLPHFIFCTLWRFDGTNFPNKPKIEEQISITQSVHITSLLTKTRFWTDWVLEICSSIGTGLSESWEPLVKKSCNIVVVRKVERYLLHENICSIVLSPASPRFVIIHLPS